MAKKKVDLTMEPGLNTDFEHPSKIFINLGTL
jgi:hypothetical protein